MSWLTMRQESDCFLLPRNTIRVISHASRCNSWSFIPRKRKDSANGLGFTYLYLCRKSAHWHSSIFKIGTVGKPAIREEREYMQNVKSSGCSSGNKTRPDGLLLFKKEIPRLLDIAPIRENVAGVEVRDYGLLYDNPWIGCLVLYTVLVDEKWAKGNEKGKSF